MFSPIPPPGFFRDRFVIPSIDGTTQSYFLGNSLGLQPKTTESAIKEVLQQWGLYGVEGFFLGSRPWMEYHDSLTGPLSKIVGALPSEVVVMNQLTVNLHLMLASFYRPVGERKKILCEAKAFPSDQYMLETHLRHYGFDPADSLIEVHPLPGEHTIRTEEILAAIDRHKNEIALVLWGGLNYYTGQVFDMKAIAAAAHTAGAKVGFDLAHAAGNISLSLHDWDADFACWCSYKYLNSGPGAVGGVFIHERYHHDPTLPRLAGWWGYDKATRFKMEQGFKPMAGAEGWQLSTPSLLLYAAHKAALDIFEEAGFDRILQAGKELTDHLWNTLDDVNSRTTKKIIEIITPRHESERGCQVSMLMLEGGRDIYEGLTRSGVIVDWREPNVIRLAPVPLYNTKEEVTEFGRILLRECARMNAN